jgi:hypothetical protein
MTNHALDQFLEELLKGNPNLNMVRVGSQSKSDSMARFSLSDPSRRPVESRRAHGAHKAALKKLATRVEAAKTGASFSSMTTVIREHAPALYHSILREFPDGSDDEGESSSDPEPI